MKPPSVTINVAGSVLNISALSSKTEFLSKTQSYTETRTHKLRQEGYNNTFSKIEILYGLLLLFFAQAGRLHATGQTDNANTYQRDHYTNNNRCVKSPALPVNTGVNIVPNPAQVPKAIDCPRATPK